MNVETIQRALGKPPGFIMRRAWAEARQEADRWLVRSRARRVNSASLTGMAGDRDIAAMWERLSNQPFVSSVCRVTANQYDNICPGDRARIFGAAENALAHQVDLLGSGPASLGENIEWQTDFKTGLGWEAEYFKDIEYNNRNRPSDVKVPWELSRLQWAIPAGQAFLLTGDERYARGVRELIESWIDRNPYASTVNWTCTMEVALRILTWTWFFHVFCHSRSWDDERFQIAFLRSLYLHADFTKRNLERSDINGNHYIADAAGLVFAGLFFGSGEVATRWSNLGWKILEDEFPRQVKPDGVDFEASVPYHRLVLELFFLPALYWKRRGFEVSAEYRNRLELMAGFTAAYSRLDGSVPLVGDGDDGRALPFGGQALNDHRYLIGLLAGSFAPALAGQFSGPVHEIFWLLGREAAETLPAVSEPECPPSSTAFADAGFYVMRNAGDHVFIDCGPVGLAGRGGHGHNDVLSFELMLDGTHLVTDSGAYVYTASYEERNRFRATASHNTPMLNGEEVNRFISPNDLWRVHYDAVPEVRQWQPGPERDVFCGTHAGYCRIHPGMRAVRTIELDHVRHSMLLIDRFEGPIAEVTIPIHLAPGVVPSVSNPGLVHLQTPTRSFLLSWGPADAWSLQVEEVHVSPSYGVLTASHQLTWKSAREKTPFLEVRIEPQGRQTL